jgi:hypothetical protein
MRSPKASKPQPLLIVAGLIVILAGACAALPFGKAGMKYEEAESKLEELVDGGLRAGMNGGQPPGGAIEREEICTDSNLAPTGEIHPTYTYHFPLEHLGPRREGFVKRVADFWEMQGLALDPDDDMEGIEGMFATSSDGFALETFVNDRTGMALVTGSGPCVEGDPAGFEEKIP